MFEADTGRVEQVAYYVQDVQRAARRLHADYDVGPFFLYEHVPLTDVTYRGAPAELDHTSAYGQYGDVMLELVQQNNPGPSCFRDLYPDDGEGLHHLAMFVGDVPAAMAAYARRGFATATHYFAGDVEVAFIDMSAARGHMLEFYAPVPALTRFYGAVRRAREKWNGEELFIRISR